MWQKNKQLLLLIPLLFLLNSCIFVLAAVLNEPSKSAAKNLDKHSPWNVDVLQVISKDVSSATLQTEIFYNIGTLHFENDKKLEEKPAVLRYSASDSLKLYWFTQTIKTEDGALAQISIKPEGYGGNEIGSGYIDNEMADLITINGIAFPKGNLLGKKFPYASADTSSAVSSYEVVWQISTIN